MMLDRRGLTEKTARIVSVLFHPLFIPLFGLTIIYSSPTLLSFIPFEIKRVVFVMVVANNVILPLSVTAVLYSRGVIKTFWAAEQHERIILLTFTLFMYTVTALLLVRTPVPSLFKAYFVSIAVVNFITLIVSFFYRLSLHAAGIGGLLALTTFMIFLFDVESISWLIALLVLTGAVMSSRQYLEEHNPGEVWIGFFTGAGVMALSLFYLLR